MEHYLQEKHAEEYMGLDDGMPEAFDAWMLNLDVDEWIEYADKYAKETFKREFHDNLPEIFGGTKDALSKLTIR